MRGAVPARGVVTLGEAMGVVVADRIGPLRLATSGRITFAGAESTVAIGVRRLGGVSSWIGTLGEDELGELILARLRAEGVATHVRRVPDVSTGLMLKERRTAMTTRVGYYRAGLAGSRLDPDDIDPDVIAPAAYLHVTGITPALSATAAAAVEKAVQVATDSGVPVSLDVNHRAALWPREVAGPVLRSLAERASLVFATRPEANVLTGVATTTDAEALNMLAELTPAAIVLKRGAQGAWAVSHRDEGRTRLEQPALPTVLVDPVGAGDAFVAGVLADLADGHELAAALATGAAVAAVAIAGDGDWEGLPTRAELMTVAAHGEDILR